jgi:phosphoribosylformimino-5-aminoimidazole carboxamide ribotide isomerase
VRVLPAIDITSEAPDNIGPRVPPSRALGVALRWKLRGCRGLHVVDLDGARGLGFNRGAIRAILEAVDVPVQVGGGLSGQAAVAEILGCGAARAIVATRALREPGWVARLSRRFPARVVVALDVLKGRLMMDGWRSEASATTSDLLASLDGLPLAGILFTDLEAEGRQGGVREAAIASILSATSHRVIVSGGVAGREDLDRLEALGVEEVVVGSALYSGRLPWREVVRR